MILYFEMVIPIMGGWLVVIFGTDRDSNPPLGPPARAKRISEQVHMGIRPCVHTNRIQGPAEAPTTCLNEDNNVTKSSLKPKMYFEYRIPVMGGYFLVIVGRDRDSIP
jgi:hypothetical protein